MSNFTNYLEHAILDHVFGGTTYTPSGTLYVGLLTGTAPSESASSFNEPPSASGYSRVAVTNNKSNWSTAAQVGGSGSVHNLNTISFPQATGPWGTVNYCAIFDASTNGNALALGDLVLSKVISSGDTPSFASGSLIIRLD